MKTTGYSRNGESFEDPNKKLISQKVYIAKYLTDKRFYPYMALKTGDSFSMWRTDGKMKCVCPTMLVFVNEDSFYGLF